GGKPEPAIAGMPAGRLFQAIAFTIFHAVGSIESLATDRADLAIGIIAQLAPRGAVDAFVARHPEVPLAVLEDHPNRIIEESRRGRITSEFILPKSVQATAAGAYPDRPFAIFIERND